MFIDAVGHLIERALTFLGMTPPAVSGSGQGRIFFNGTKFRVSENGGPYTDLAGVTIPSGDWQIVFERHVPGGAVADITWVDTGIVYDEKYDYAMGVTYLNAGPAIGSSVAYFFSGQSSGTYATWIKSLLGYLPDGVTSTTFDGAVQVYHKSQLLAYGGGNPYFLSNTKTESMRILTDGKFYTYYATPTADAVYFVIVRRQVLP